MRYVIVDLEASCWASGMSRGHMEIIEIGAVKLASSSGPVLSAFETFVRPVAHPELSGFCTELTGIQQEQVDAAEPFPDAFARFVGWIGPEPFRLCSWGAYDLNQFQTDCRRHKIDLPGTFASHINLKREFSRVFNTKPLGMNGALAHLKLTPEGQHHRGGDDSRNIARIAQKLLPRIEAEAAAIE